MSVVVVKFQSWTMHTVTCRITSGKCIFLCLCVYFIKAERVSQYISIIKRRVQPRSWHDWSRHNPQTTPCLFQVHWPTLVRLQKYANTTKSTRKQVTINQNQRQTQNEIGTCEQIYTTQRNLDWEPDVSAKLASFSEPQSKQNERNKRNVCIECQKHIIKTETTMIKEDLKYEMFRHEVAAYSAPLFNGLARNSACRNRYRTLKTANPLLATRSWMQWWRVSMFPELGVVVEIFTKRN